MPIVDTQFVLFDEDYRQVLAVIERLARDAHAKGVFLVDKNGQLLAEAGDVRGIDTTSLASLTAGSVAATGGLAKIIGEEEFPVHFHQGERDNLHMSVVAHRVILVVIFDEHSSLGLVRLRVKKSSTELARLFEEIEKKSQRAASGGGSPFSEITDDDIDKLFAD
jgi:predicted regulator of Ras-like GTPase activity (Roadblock/LC7/MglB family)